MMKAGLKIALGVTVALASLVFTALGIAQNLPVELLIQEKYLVLILLPAICTVIARALKDPMSWPLSLQRIGIPLGIFCSSIYAHDFFTSMSDPDDVMPSIAEAILAVLYGGVITAIGIAHGTKNRIMSEIEKGKSRKLHFVLIALVFISLTVLVELAGHRYSPFWDDGALMVFGGVLGLTIALQSFNPEVESILNAIIIAMLAVTFVTLCGWLLATDDPVKTGRIVSFGLAGLCLCSALLAAIAMCGPNDESNNRTLERTNWHALEVYSLFFLVILAPPSLIEIISE